MSDEVSRLVIHEIQNAWKDPHGHFLQFDCLCGERSNVSCIKAILEHPDSPRRFRLGGIEGFGAIPVEAKGRTPGHAILRIYQERRGEISYTCECGASMKHVPLPFDVPGECFTELDQPFPKPSAKDSSE